MDWPEIKIASEEHRHDLVLTGPEVADRVAKLNGLPEQLFRLRWLNFLEISKAGLESIDVVNFKHLNRLVLHSNKLSTIPSEISLLQKLKHLDLSFNELKSIPVELNSLKDLQNLNLSYNQINQLPDLAGLQSLITFNAAYNQLDQFPLWLCNSSLEHLGEIDMRHNQIPSIPTEISITCGLRTLHLEENDIHVVPYEICQCLKLKELCLAGNKLKDRRLQKMLADCRLNSVMEYIRKTLVPDDSGSRAQPNASNTVRKSAGAKVSVSADAPELHVVISSSIAITATKDVGSVRPFLVCCVVRDVVFDESKFKKFIKLQTKLHDTICNKRMKATIATHDFNLINFPLVYTARAPTLIEIKPLRGGGPICAVDLVRTLNQEADQLRKEKKRNNYSGIHQYLYMLKPLSKYACLIDATEAVISLPPITNSEVTKISSATKNIFVEVTSTENLAICKTVADTLLHEMLTIGLGPVPPGEENDPAGKAGRLKVEQVRVLTDDGTMKVAYPSKVDLELPNVRVIRTEAALVPEEIIRSYADAAVKA